MKKEYSIERIGRRTAQEIEKLAEIWEASVRATHDFLGEEDIQGLVPEVKAGLKLSLIHISPTSPRRRLK